MADIAQDMTSAVSTSGALLQGVGDEQLKNKQLNQEQLTSGLNYIKDASGKTIDFMSQVNQQKAMDMRQRLAIEAQAEKQKVAIAAQQTAQTRKMDADKSKADYENFFTMTPELADGLHKSSGGKLDFRRAIGQRMQTKVVIPLAQIFGREVDADKKANAAGAKGSNSQKDLNALKAFTGEYDKKKKDFDDPLKSQMAARNLAMSAQRQKDQAWLQQNEGKYNEAIGKIGKTGGLSDDPKVDNSTATPPPTSSSDIDALIDKASEGMSGDK